MGASLFQFPRSFRYTCSTVRTTFSLLLLISLATTVGLADETSFQRIKVPDSKGDAVKAVLTFSDDNKAIEIQPVKGDPVTIPYAQIDKFVYEYTKKHRVNEGTIASAAVGVGAVFMFTKSKIHWLEIDYHEGNIPKAYVIQMDKHNYMRVLEAVSNHTGKDPEVLGNADKRRR